MIRYVRKACGLVVVLAAISSIAYAIPPPPSTPEIDPGSMLSALTLLSGGLLLITDRRKSKKA